MRLGGNHFERIDSARNDVRWNSLIEGCELAAMFDGESEQIDIGYLCCGQSDVTDEKVTW